MTYKVYFPCRPDTYFDNLKDALAHQSRFGGVIYYRHANGNYYQW